jgi:hypothetical protein
VTTKLGLLKELLPTDIKRRSGGQRSRLDGGRQCSKTDGVPPELQVDSARGMEPRPNLGKKRTQAEPRLKNEPRPKAEARKKKCG